MKNTKIAYLGLVFVIILNCFTMDQSYAVNDSENDEWHWTSRYSQMQDHPLDPEWRSIMSSLIKNPRQLPPLRSLYTIENQFKSGIINKEEAVKRLKGVIEFQDECRRESARQSAEFFEKCEK